METNLKKTNLEKCQKIFGEPVAHMPEDYPVWDGPAGTVFWAPRSQWNSWMLRDTSDVRFKFSGPYRRGDVPFEVSCDGYSVFVAD